MRATLLLALLLGCSAPTITTAPDVDAGGDETGLASLTLDSWDVLMRLHGFDPTANTRLANVIDSLVTDEEVDVECLQNLPRDEDRARVLAATKTRFPYSAHVSIDATTPIDDPRDLTGVTRKVELTPACSEPSDIARLDARVACLRDRCRDVAGYVDRACMARDCVTFSYPTGKRCAQCLDNGVANLALEAIHDTCVTKPRGEMTGQLGALLLSRFPLTNPKVHVFPSSAQQRAAVSATLEAKGRTLQVVCADLGYGGGGPPGSYAGVFGAPDENAAMFHESELVYIRLIELGRALGATRPTLLLGSQCGQWTVSPSGEAISDRWLMWATNFSPIAIPTKNVCTICRKNPLGALIGFAYGGPNFFDQIMFASGRAFPVEMFGNARTEASYTIAGKAVPASPWYSARARITLP